ncbi:N-terminal phage integrase SAM-like domain-containing protein [Nocardiopsis sp. NPDC049922]|uniref:N-terminal phage integrase SAM-like domain-containing protein n=1 Tax=Nocardiopsis sp. NPDC049922 TaxID=3155157 RepID=UPI0033E7D7AD
MPETVEVKRRIGAGARTREKIPVVAQWLKEWLNGKPDLAPKTRASYEGHIRNHLVPHLGPTRLDKLTSWQVEEMFAAIEENNQRILECRESDNAKVRDSVKGQRVISLSTKHRIRATLRSAFSEAVRRPDLPVAVMSAQQAVGVDTGAGASVADRRGGAGGGDGVDTSADHHLPDPRRQVPVVVPDVPPHRRQGAPAR